MSLIRPLAKDRNKRVFRAYLAEEYDGIGQWVMVTLSRGSTSGAMRAKIGAGDFNTGARFPVGTPVTVFVNRGFVHILDLGTLGTLRTVSQTSIPQLIELNQPFGTVYSDPVGAITNPQYANDGNGTTHTDKPADGNCYIVTDLGAVYSCTSVYASINDFGDDIFDVFQYSVDGSAWTTPSEGWVPAVHGPSTMTFGSPVSARYFRGGLLWPSGSKVFIWEIYGYQYL